MKEWKDVSNHVSYYWDIRSGLVVGQINKITHTEIYTAKAFVDLIDEEPLGRYINPEFAKQGVERYWRIQERTLKHDKK